MKHTQERVIKELDKIRDEMTRAEADANSRLAILQGWQNALEWVLDILDAETSEDAHVPVGKGKKLYYAKRADMFYAAACTAKELGKTDLYEYNIHRCDEYRALAEQITGLEVDK